MGRAPKEMRGSPTLLPKIKIREEGKQMRLLTRTLQGAWLFFLFPKRNSNPPLPRRRQTQLWKSPAIQAPIANWKLLLPALVFANHCLLRSAFSPYE